MSRSEGIWLFYLQEGICDADPNKLCCLPAKLVSASISFEELAWAQACFGLE